MNNVLDIGSNPCSSCGVCAVICPTKCITIVHNNEGFYRPQVNENTCTACGICKKICYKYIPQPLEFKNYFVDKQVYGAWSKDEYTQNTATSGGVGHELLKWGVEHGYEACGVIFDATIDKCKHTIENNPKQLETFKSSKYLQSYTIDAFSQFARNKKYIVVGTPCQIFGLRQMIQQKKREDDFILIDFFCHGTPTILLWNKYKEYITNKENLASIKEVVFRSKEKSSWHSYAMKISDTHNKTYLKDRAFSEDMFFKFFLSDTCLNDSCYNCLLRLDTCASDIRIADFWGEKYANNEKGVSLVTVNTEKGKTTFELVSSQLVSESCSFEDLQNSQPIRFAYKNSSEIKKVILLLQSDLILDKIYRKTIAPSFMKKGKSITKQFAKQILGEKGLNIIAGFKSQMQLFIKQ